MAALLLLLTLLLQPAPPPPTYEWTVPHRTSGAGVVTWTGPGELVKHRGGQSITVAWTDEAGVVRTKVPGPAPVDILLRPLPGDVYCAPAGCVTVPAPLTPRAVLPVVFGA